MVPIIIGNRYGGRGHYSAIVYKENNRVKARGPENEYIKEGTAGTDDFEILQAAIDQFSENEIHTINISTSSLEIDQTLEVPQGISLKGEGRFDDWGGGGTRIIRTNDLPAVRVLGSRVNIEDIGFIGDPSHTAEFITVASPPYRAYLGFRRLAFYAGNCTGIDLKGAFWVDIEDIRAVQLGDYIVKNIEGTPVFTRFLRVIPVESSAVISLKGCTNFLIEECGTDYNARVNRPQFMIRSCIGSIRNTDLEGNNAQGYPAIGFWLSNSIAVFDTCRFWNYGDPADPCGVNQPIYLSEGSRAILNGVRFEDTKSIYDVLVADPDSRYVDNLVSWSKGPNRKMENYGEGIGSGAQKDIEHGLITAPSKVYLTNKSATANAFQSEPADDVYIHVTASPDQGFVWYAEV